MILDSDTTSLSAPVRPEPRNATPPAPPGSERAPDALVERVIAQLDQGHPGPLVLVLGGLHGNEPAGVHAAREVARVLDERLRRGEARLAGRIVFLSGNRRALAAEKRFLHTDLNRMWTDERIARVRAQGPTEDTSEESELRELLEILEFELAEPPGPAILLDLHSTSAAGAPFAIVADTLRNLELTGALPIPTLLGLEERIDGPLLSWFADQGQTSIVVEGGQNEAPSTRVHHAATIWLTLVATGNLELDEHPEVLVGRELLAAVAGGLPALVEVCEAHPIRHGDGFKMLPGFDNFQRVRNGQRLASDLRGAIRANRSGHILMPLYQGQGEDGFFLGYEIKASWLRFARWCRRSRLASLLSHLPGLAPHPFEPGTLIRSGEPLRPLVRSFLRFFGYRKERLRDGYCVLERRSQ